MQMSKRRGPSLRTTAAISAGLAVGVGLVYGLLVLTSDSPSTAMQGLFTGAFSNPGRISQWISYSSFLMFTGASVCLVFRVGLFSIGAEGQVFIGALLAGIAVLALGPTPFALPLGVLAATVGGFIWGLIPGLMKAYLGTDEIVTSLMMNYIGTFCFAFIIKQFLQPEGAGFPVSEFFDLSALFPVIGRPVGISTTIVLATLICLLVSFTLNRTRLGYALKAVGDSPRFAHANGLKVPQLIWTSIALSGAIAGIGGAAVALGGTDRLILGMATGLGFDGILVALLAVNRPALVPVTALLYGYFRVGGDVIQITSNVPRDVIVILQGIVILVLAAAIRQREKKQRQGTQVLPAATADREEASLIGPDADARPQSGGTEFVTAVHGETASTEGKDDVSRNRS